MALCAVEWGYAGSTAGHCICHVIRGCVAWHGWAQRCPASRCEVWLGTAVLLWFSVVSWCLACCGTAWCFGARLGMAHHGGMWCGLAQCCAVLLLGFVTVPYDSV